MPAGGDNLGGRSAISVAEPTSRTAKPSARTCRRARLTALGPVSGRRNSVERRLGQISEGRPYAGA
jgi:hypothetical protein